MDQATVNLIVANPYVSPEDLIKHYVSNPLYLEEWLNAKGNELAGVSNDCNQCVIAAYLQEKLTSEGVEFRRLDLCYTHCFLFMEDEEEAIKLPQWVRDYVTAVDAYQNHSQDTWARQVILSGKIAADILKATLEVKVE